MIKQDFKLEHISHILQRSEQAIATRLHLKILLRSGSYRHYIVPYLQQVDKGIYDYDRIEEIKAYRRKM